jgi:subtilisin family serine protease
MARRRCTEPKRNQGSRGGRWMRRVVLEFLEPRWLLSVAPGDRPFAPDRPAAPAPHQLLVGLADPHLAAYRSGGQPALLQSAGSLFQGMQAWHPEDNLTVQVLQDLGTQLTTRWWLPSHLDTAEILANLGQMPGVTLAEPNFTVSIQTQPNDPRFSELWGLHNTGQTGGKVDADIDAPEAWDVATGSSSILVGVIDTGVDYRHVDLYRNIWINQGEIPTAVRSTLADADGDGLITFWDLNAPANSGRVTDRNGNGYIDGGDLLADPAWENGIDNDGNSYIDDLVGWDFINNDNDPLDDHDHGTHVAGTIGGVGNNGAGVAGVNWRVQIVGLKFLGFDGGGSTADAIRAVDYATALKNAGVNIKLTSNSWGGGGFSAALRSSIEAAGTAGQLFVAAAGNSSSNSDQFPAYPASYDLPNIVSVAATNHLDNLSSFSNFGAVTVDLAAPGESVLSTVRNNGYAVFSGTSMATPHVAGVAALAWSINDTATHTEIRDAMYQSVDVLPALSGKTATGGRLNARGTLDLAQNSRGRISLDRAAYGLSAVVHIRVSDGDLNTNPNAPDSLQVELTSTTEAAAEFVTLVETGNSTSTFAGTIPLGAGNAVPGDGRLQVAHADRIVATYRDAFDGTGPADVTAEATVDGLPPQISQVFAVPSPRRANILWTTDEIADSVVHY